MRACVRARERRKGFFVFVFVLVLVRKMRRVLVCSGGKKRWLDRGLGTGCLALDSEHGQVG